MIQIQGEVQPFLCTLVHIFVIGSYSLFLTNEVNNEV